jgi:alkanesulfonate monooxygenase SsuD/methylene tetrahydromethanopterin reductase-like flavin-dependent oxidoreductase (luciferase family)
MRRGIAQRLPWAQAQLKPLGIAEEVSSFLRQYPGEAAARALPDAWVDALSAAGTPQQAADAIQRWFDAGVDALIFQPLDGDLDCLDEYARDLMPLLKG